MIDSIPLKITKTMIFFIEKRFKKTVSSSLQQKSERLKKAYKIVRAKA